MDTREEYLTILADRLDDFFFMKGYHVPQNRRFTCAPPHNKTALGVCYNPVASKDQCYEIVISSVLDNPVEIAGVLLHELCHTIAGIKAGHKSTFRKIALEVGLTGKMTATTPGEELKKDLKTIVYMLGEYPHASLLNTREKKQGTRLIKVECPDCGYVARIAQKWIDRGMPTCPCGTTFELP